MLLFVFFVPLLGRGVLSEKYTRESLQKEYPGFGTEWIPMSQTADGKFEKGYFSNDLNDGRFSLSPEPSEVVTFKLYTRKYPNGTEIGDSISEIAHIFDKNKPSKFITHGWMSSGTSDTCTGIKDGFLAKYDTNVFIMDWSAIAGNVIYPIPMSATKSVGEYYSQFLNKLVEYGANPKDFHLVGHSLGAHVSGFAARDVENGPVKRVTGLDPALPGFSGIEVVEGGRLFKSDAEFVDVIHTCAGFLGIRSSIGHADFYPNGGSVPQPGCESISLMMEACSHGKSWKFFRESLVSEVPFRSYKCRSFEELQKGQCDNDGIPMGDPVPFTARGDYYLRTNHEEPFAIKDVENESDNNLLR